jgi:hypothetical protein
LSAASQGVAQVVKDAGTGVQGVHEIQVTLRKYEFSPGLLRVKKGEQVRLIMTAVDQSGFVNSQPFVEYFASCQVVESMSARPQ